MRKLVSTLAAVAALASTPVAHANDVAMRVQDVPAGPRSLAAVPTALHFNMFALHWVGSGEVLFRTHRLHGAWSSWAAADADVAPDGGSGRRHDGNLEWSGAADAFQIRRSGPVGRLQAYELWSRVTTRASRHLAQAGLPAVVSRADWHANEEIVRAAPRFAPAVRLAIVHHTATSNSYTPAQAAAIVRGIEVYHVKGNGWDDIGYNFLVDRFGTVYEGRAGGIARNVIGAHAEGFNSGTVGVALIGNFTNARPPKAMQAALVDLLAWRLDVAHIDPLSRVVYLSGGNAKFRAGRSVTLRAISGHRDTGPSECPGSAAYALLPDIAKRVSLTGLPKLYSPTVEGVVGGPVRFRARASSGLPWTVTITDLSGTTVDSETGQGVLVDWTWSSAAAGRGRFNWTIAVPGARPVRGTIGSGGPAPPPPPVPPPPLSLLSLAALPVVLAPVGDGTGDASTVTFTLGAPATVTAQVRDAGGAPVLSLPATQRTAGSNGFTWSAAALPDGRYLLVVTARAGAKSVSKSVPVTVDRTLTRLAPASAVLSPNGDGLADSAAFSFDLALGVPVRLDIEQGGVIVASPFQGALGAGPHTLAWDGTANGVPLPDGRYAAVITVTDGLGDVRIPLPVTIDTRPPTLRLLDPLGLRFSLDEPATVTLVVDSEQQIVITEPKGTFAIPFRGPAHTFSAQAQDAAGNSSAVVAG